MKLAIYGATKAEGETLILRLTRYGVGVSLDAVDADGDYRGHLINWRGDGTIYRYRFNGGLGLKTDAEARIKFTDE